MRGPSKSDIPPLCDSLVSLASAKAESTWPCAQVNLCITSTSRNLCYLTNMNAWYQKWPLYADARRIITCAWCNEHLHHHLFRAEGHNDVDATLAQKTVHLAVEL